MKIIIKTLSGQTFELEVQQTDSVLNIKEKIEKVKQFEIAQQKLLRKGTLLLDDQTVGDLGIQEKDFLVVMVNVKRSPPQQQPVQQQVQQPPQQPQPVQPQQPVEVSKPLNNPTSNNMVTGSEYDLAIQNLIQMGFAKTECEAAMKAAFNNQNRAIEYLLNGIPVVNQPPPQQAQNVNQVDQNTLQQLREQFIQNPQAVLQSLQQLQQTNPQLYQQIQQNPETVIQLLMGAGQDGGDEIETEITQEEEQQLNQLMMMGFTKEDALEGFLACDKNVETAASYLFEKQARGDLLSQHYEREENNPENYNDEGNEGEEDDQDDDDQYY
ncbi:unnamed protein product [Paramecium pentaurelia]|uniref:UV excision repair protein RAD23 n=1 Tax=Paramecium pentaurelia TaxID=43138 RepID=A0A8S1VUP8_9CILI|nr:unnamed protein product [Paramecium pentaurelia]